MFGANQFATVNGFGVRIKDEREKDRHHLIEVTYEVPLTHALADEIMPAMARDLYQEAGGEFVPKPEINETGFNLAPETQLMTVRMHPDMDPVFRTPGVNLRRIKAKKTEANTWSLYVTASWQLGQDVEITTIVRALKQPVYLTFEAQQVSLLDTGQAPDDGTTAKVDQSGNVHSIESGRKKKAAGAEPKPKKRGRKAPEAEAAAQVAEGTAKAADDPGDEQPGTDGPVH